MFAYLQLVAHRAAKTHLAPDGLQVYSSESFFLIQVRSYAGHIWIPVDGNVLAVKQGIELTGKGKPFEHEMANICADEAGELGRLSAAQLDRGCV